MLLLRQLLFCYGCILGDWWRHHALYGCGLGGGGRRKDDRGNKYLKRDIIWTTHLQCTRTKRICFHVSHIEYIEQLSKRVFQVQVCKALFSQCELQIKKL